MPLFSHSASEPVTMAMAGRASELWLGLLMPPVLLGLLAGRALADGLTQVGLASEQWFAGERLPSLNVSPVGASPTSPSAIVADAPAD